MGREGRISMDADRFDRFARHVATRANRRGLLKWSAGGALALITANALRGQAAADSGFEGDVCDTSADCKTGLICEGSSTGLLGGTLAGAEYGPPGVSIPLIDGKSGRCRYRGGDNCAKVDQACDRDSDCCGDLNLVCRNKKCKRG